MRWRAARQHTRWPIYHRRTDPSRTIPSSSGHWQLSVSGTPRHSGTCSCMADRIQKEIFTVELPTDLDGLIELALRVNAHLQQCDQRGRHKLVSEFPEYSTANSCKMVSHPSDCEPMQVGRAQLSREKRDRRRANYLCYFSLYCGAAGHFLADCPVKGQARQ